MLSYLLGLFDKREPENGTLPWFLEQMAEAIEAGCEQVEKW
ncbi:MAG: hypothetical protein ACE5JU_13000 [Candidatus Binatia bacterium]